MSGPQKKFAANLVVFDSALTVLTNTKSFSLEVRIAACAIVDCIRNIIP